MTPTDVALQIIAKAMNSGPVNPADSLNFIGLAAELHFPDAILDAAANIPGHQPLDFNAAQRNQLVTIAQAATSTVQDVIDFLLPLL